MSEVTLSDHMRVWNISPAFNGSDSAGSPWGGISGFFMNSQI